jgi:enolase-phosphatase E1
LTDPAPEGAVLLDVEGTTTSVSFVYDVLFPFARGRLDRFLRARAADPGVREDVARLASERRVESERGAPEWRDASPEDLLASASAYAAWLMDRDRKSTGLKSLQGRIWESGYRAGEITGHVYPDVPPALERWRAEGRPVAIYSSGSVLAQRLLFAHTPAGDLTRWIDAHFDTTTGPKREAESYRRIARSLGAVPGSVLFVSDVTAELDAAREAGLRTALCVRSGETPAGAGHPVVRTLEGI